jgi:hypothetical protein
MSGIIRNVFKESIGYFKLWLVASIVALVLYISNFIPFLGWMTGERFWGTVLAAFVLWPIRGLMYGIAFWAIRMIASIDKTFAAKVRPYLVVNKLHPKKNKDDPEQVLDKAILGAGNLVIASICVVVAVLLFVCCKASSMFVVINWRNILHWCSTLVSGLWGGISSTFILAMNIWCIFVVFSTLRWVKEDYDLNALEYLSAHRNDFLSLAVILLIVKSLNTIYFAYAWNEVGWNFLFFLVGLLIYATIFATTRFALKKIADLHVTTSDDSDDGSEFFS